MNKSFPIVWMFVSCSLLFSCTKDPDPEPGPEPERYVTLSIDVSVDTTDVATKTSMDGETGIVKWSPSDVLTVHFYQSTLKSVETGTAQNIRNEGRSATFTYKVAAKDSLRARNSSKYVYYGKHSLVLDDEHKPLSVSIPSSQNYAGSYCFEDGENISIGYMKGRDDSDTGKPDTTCFMQNIFGILKVNISLSSAGKNIGYVQLTDNNPSNYLAGDFQFIGLPDGTAGSEPVISHKSGSGGESLSIIKKVSGSISGGDFYFLVPPGTLFSPEGFNLYVYTKDGYYGGKRIKLSSTGQASIERSVVTVVPITPVNPKPIPTSLPLTANSYIVPSEAGPYSIPAQYMGNGYQGNRNTQFAGASGTFGPKSFGIDNAVSAEVLWQGRLNGDAILAGEVVSDALYFVKDNCGYIGFHRSGVEGNALVALKDAAGNILWSWHLWIVDKNDVNELEAGEMMYQQYGDKLPVFTIMDRNLGALSAHPDDLSQSHGLAFQYARKDPYMGTRFAGPTSSDGATGYESFATIYPGTGIYCVTNTVSLQQSISAPNVRAVPSNGYWCASKVYWGDPDGDDSKDSPKTLYDPCPAGWRSFEEKNLAVVLGVDPATEKIARPVGEVVRSGDGYAFKLSNQDSNGTGHPVYFPGAGYSASTTEVTQIGKVAGFWGANYIVNQASTLPSQATYIKIAMNGTGTDYTSDIPHADLFNSMPVRCQKWDEPSLPDQSDPSYIAAHSETAGLEVVTIQ